MREVQGRDRRVGRDVAFYERERESERVKK